ncbi:group II intron maturase-specific domain-containing protein [Nitrospira sp. Kam-Ns4a]
MAEGSVLRLVRLFLETLIQDGDRLGRPRAGTPPGGVISPRLANSYLAKLDRVWDAEGVRFVREAEELRLCSRKARAARQALHRTTAVLATLGLRLNPRTTKLVTLHQGVDFLGYRLIQRKGHLNVSLAPKGVRRFRAEIRRVTRRTAGVALRPLVPRLDRYVRGWGEYVKRAQVAGVFDRLDRWITRRLRAFLATRWRNQLWRRYPDQVFWAHLGLTRLYALRRDFIRTRGVRPRAGTRSGERSAGKPHATFVRGTEPSVCPF